MKKRLRIIIIISAVILGIVGFWYYQKNIYSKEILKLEILGPEGVELGEEIEYTVKYKNNGNIRLEEPKLVFEYPEHSIVEGEFLRKEIDLEDIYPGQEQTINFKARLLGKENKPKIAKAEISYRPKNLNAKYRSTTSFTTIIKKVPLTFEFDLPTKIESGKDLRFRLNYFSNVNYPLPDLRCVVEYPTDFEFIESRPRALEKTEWEIGLLNKTEGGRIEILGKVFGEVGEEKIFKAQLGTWRDGEFVLLKEAIKGVQISQLSLYVVQQINGNPQYIASPGDLLHYEIFFRNIGEEALSNLSLIASLESRALDFQTIKAPLGSFKSGDNSIVFDWRKVASLQFLNPQEEGKIEFWINLKEEWEILGLQDKNPVIKNKIYLGQATQEEFETKINSKLVLEQKGYFQEAVFGNSGPIPPRVGETTTYTIIWQIKNYYNDLRNAKVKAILPAQVKLTGKILPEGAKLTFDSNSRELVWDIGDIGVGAGILTAAPNLAFQIDFTPADFQRGQTPEIISQATFTAEDTFTGTILETTAPAINTSLPDDETVSPEQGIVQ